MKKLMSNYRAWFRGFDRQHSNNPYGDLYCIHIGNFSANTYTELLLADTPFVVQYNTSKTPFDPVRTSTATIKVLNSGYTVDLFPTKAQELPVVLYNETKARIEWCGFITPKVYDGSYVDCLDEINIEAADCISSLQYIDYDPVSMRVGERGIVSLDKILGNICGAAGILERFYWTNGKMLDYNSSIPMLPESIYLSEQNFFTSDTDEPWKMSEVLEEICRYFGFTCMQFGNAMYLIDFLAYKENQQLITRYYTVANNYAYGGVEYLTGGNLMIDADAFRGSNSSISLEPIYNKCTVKANMYACERIMPEIFADDNLVNRLDSGNFYTNIELTVPDPKTPSFPYGGIPWILNTYYQDYKRDEKVDGEPNTTADTKYRYFLRIYDNTKGWESVYSGHYKDKHTTQTNLTALPGATIVDLGVVKNVITEEYGQKIVPSKLDYTRYLMINQKNIGGFGVWPSDYLVFDYSFKNNVCPFDKDNAFLVIQGSELNTKYVDRCYINPDWDTKRIKLATFDVEYWDDTNLCFLVKIGNNYWNGTGWTTTRTVFLVDMKRNGENIGESNTEREVLNNVSYNVEVGEDGYLIPLSGISFSLDEQIDIQVHMPTCQYQINGQNEWNGFVWIKDLDIKLVQKGQSNENNEGDMIYENVINDDAVNELSDITCKITSYTSGVAPSYSTAMYSNSGNIVPLSGFVDNSSTEARAGEENIIEKYVQEYQHQTRKIMYTLDNQMNGLRPWSRFLTYDPEEPNQMYVVLGEEIDYQNGTNTITAVELK